MKETGEWEQHVNEYGQIFNIQCTNSSNFVVGKQNNFHAPVTIINNSNLNKCGDSHLCNGGLVKDGPWGSDLSINLGESKNGSTSSYKRSILVALKCAVSAGKDM